jgi:hypothetical protein
VQHRSGLGATQPGDGVAAAHGVGDQAAEEHLQLDLVGEPVRELDAVTADRCGEAAGLVIAQAIVRRNAGIPTSTV